MDEKAKTIRSRILLKESPWTYKNDTNCYAFALGLDYPYYMISVYAYNLGSIATYILGIPEETIETMSYEEQFLLDLKALEITVAEIKSNGHSCKEYSKNIVRLNWIVALMQSSDDFHFLRKSFGGSGIIRWAM